MSGSESELHSVMRQISGMQLSILPHPPSDALGCNVPVSSTSTRVMHTGGRLAKHLSEKLMLQAKATAPPFPSQNKNKYGGREIPEVIK
jgi:hypothetical protein